MNIKNTTLSLILLLSLQLFSQEGFENKEITPLETKLSYLDSIKKTFIKDDLASCVDSLWMKELTNLELYNSLSEDIQNVNIDEKIEYELSTELLKERLAAMDAKSPFNIEYNQGLENIIKSFLKNRKKSFERLMAVSEYYFPVFEEALAKQNVPLEIKYLAVVESALNPKAVSKMGATGLWQFMYQTGKQYGLKIDSYVDERSDPLKASEAAAHYMTNMYRIFGDWDLVLASYNSGPGNVSKAIRRSGGQQNYWNIRKNLPKETQGYVPAFLATMYIYEYHKEHGIVPNKATIKHFATDTILIRKQMSFKQISDLLDVPVVQLQILNPSYKLNMVPFYHDENHYLRLPQEKIAIFASNEDQIYAYIQQESDQRERPFHAAKAVVIKDTAADRSHRVTSATTFYYKVKRGDNLTAVANKYNVSISEIKKWNALKSTTLTYGKNLKIITGKTGVRSTDTESKTDYVATQSISKSQNIVASDTKVNMEEKINNNSTALSTNTSILYEVQKGDNLSSIAKKYNVTVAAIQEWNGLSNDTVQFGTSLQIAKKEMDARGERTSNPERKDLEYVVMKGDNLGNIASKFGTSQADLKQWNNFSNNTITIGKTLIVAKDEIAILTDKATANSFRSTSNSTSTSKKISVQYYVKKGDSLFSIAKKHPGVTISDLKKWNGIRSEDIKPGMKLKING
ncbi:LysM peptidoglycan-binding domain-containing protein [Flavobacterium sp. LB2R40]|uniref:LysM peptidoglycan-binding domain-containing protein n=1 Tax=unclassified Flavobacterium TaxID=196869 RepID=UPI003AAFBF05